MATTAEVEALRRRLLWDTPFWASQCATIRTESKHAVRLIARPWQLKLDQALEAQRAAGMPMRAIVLKARKLGVSTWVQAKFVHRVTMHEAQHALVAAHDRKTAGVLFDMAKLMYDRLPPDPVLADMIYGEDTTRGAPFSVRPQHINGGSSRGGQAKWMVLGDRRRPSDASVYETLTAGAKAAGRGATPSLLHCSEIAHYEDPDYKTGLLNSLPTEPETICVLESTAKGFNDFHAMWVRAVEGAEDPDFGGYYAPLFFSWFDNPANARAFATDAARERFERTLGDPNGGGDEEEIELAESFGVSLEQLFWRRTKLHGPEHNSDLEDFHQEWPATPEQAFIGSGKPVFPGILVARAIKAAAESRAPVEGLLRGVEWKERRTRAGTVRVPGRALWVPQEMIEQRDTDVWGAQHRLRVWGHPLNEDTQRGLAAPERKPDGQYVAFVDIARGAGGTTSEDRDWQAVQVLDHVRRVQVASYRSRVPIHDLPLLVYLIGLYWNTAWVAVEVTGLGIGVLDALAKDFRYPMLYRRRRAGDDERSDARERMLGWETTLRTKPLMEQTMGDAFREASHGMRDVATARQFTTYVEDPKNPVKHGAQRGSHDDLVMSYMGAVRVAAELRPRPPRKGGRSRFVVRDDVTGY